MKISSDLLMVVFSEVQVRVEVKLLEVNGRDATATEAMNMGATWVVLDKYVPSPTTSVQYISVAVAHLNKLCEPQRA